MVIWIWVFQLTEADSDKAIVILISMIFVNFITFLMIKLFLQVWQDCSMDHSHNLSFIDDFLNIITLHQFTANYGCKVKVLPKSNYHNQFDGRDRSGFISTIDLLQRASISIFLISDHL